jgi:protein TonB
MKQTRLDWKDIADSYYDKAVSLAVLIMLFSFLVSPKMEVKPYKRVVKEIESIDIPDEIKEEIKPPEPTVRPQVQIIVTDELEAGEDDEELEILDTIAETSLDMQEEVAPPTRQQGSTNRFQVYEEAPVAIKVINPKYPPNARSLGIEGAVVLNVEVFEDGSVGAIEVVESLLPGPGGLDEAAINAVRQWEFNPAKSNGQPVAVWVTFPVEFTLH